MLNNTLKIYTIMYTVINVLNKPLTIVPRRQSALINVLYNPSALQCKNCGLRYSPTDMIAYSQHLDWHFRMKRREKENARKAQSRTWYFERMDWINSDEIVDGDKGKFYSFTFI
jgi:hypothetical protein